MGLAKGIRIVGERLSVQGPHTTVLWALDHAVRIITGAPIRALSQITPQIHIGGQYRQRGWRRLARRGVTAVVNMRIEYDDRVAGIAPPHYLHLPTVDETAPSLEHLEAGVAYVAQEIEGGGAVFVHCGSGIGRAATLVAAYLVRQGLSPEQAWACIQQVRPFVRPTAVQLEQLERFAARAAAKSPDKRHLSP